MANGRLTEAAAERLPEPLRQVAEETGATPDAVALAAVLHRPWVTVVLSGAATTAQLRSNLAAVGLDLDERRLAGLERLAEPAEDYWRHRSQLPWS